MRQHPSRVGSMARGAISGTGVTPPRCFALRPSPKGRDHSVFRRTSIGFSSTSSWGSTHGSFSAASSHS